MRHARPIVVCLELFMALNAIGGGIYALSGAPNVPTAWLRGTPFNDYTVPGIALLLGATTMILAATTLMLRWRFATQFSKVAGVLLMMWIVVQVTMIGSVSWMQPVSFLMGAIIFGLAFVVRDRELHGWQNPPLRAAR